MKPTDVILETRLALGDVTVLCDELSRLPAEKIEEFAATKLDMAAFRFDRQERKLRWKGLIA